MSIEGTRLQVAVAALRSAILEVAEAAREEAATRQGATGPRRYLLGNAMRVVRGMAEDLNRVLNTYEPRDD